MSQSIVHHPRPEVRQVTGYPMTWQNIPITPNHILPCSCNKQTTSKVAASPSWPVLSAKKPGKVNNSSGDLLRALSLCHCFVEFSQLSIADSIHPTSILCWQHLQLCLQPHTELWTVKLHNLLRKEGVRQWDIYYMIWRIFLTDIVIYNDYGQQR